MSAYLTAREVAARLKITRNTVDVLVRRGKIPPPIRLGSRLLRWDARALDAAMATPHTPPEGERLGDASWERSA